MAWTIEFEERVERDLWRYRGRDYRIVCKFEHDRFIVLVVAIGHRSQVYK